MKKCIYILHERGAKSHFYALEKRAFNAGFGTEYREFSIGRTLIKGIIKLNLSIIQKQLVNLSFLFKLVFSKNLRVVVGIAPFDWRLTYLRLMLSKQQTYYFTSWPYWKSDRVPKKKLARMSLVLNSWGKFLQTEIKGVLCVTQSVQRSLLSKYRIKCPIRVVHHAIYLDPIKGNCNSSLNSSKIKLLFVGRLINDKRILEVIDLVKSLDKERYELTIVGDGNLNKTVKREIKGCLNIHFKGFVDNRADLNKIYGSHHFLLMLSRKTESWEELFGIAIIEGMSNGVVPIATNHIGPLEIIENNSNGFIIEDDKSTISVVRDILLKIKDKKFQNLREKSIIRAMDFDVNKLSEKWDLVLNG